MRRTWIGLAFTAAVAGVVAVVACGNNANDVAGCRILEDARCDRALECGLDPSFPLHAGNTDADFVTACKLFYEDACLHGFVTSIDITPSDQDNCYSAIKTASCNIVINPQLDPRCSWLIPPDAGVDAGLDATTVDGTATTSGNTTTIIIGTTSSSSTGDGGETDAEAVRACEASCDMTCVGDPTCTMMCETTCAQE
jgi:hypothetical protein